MKVSGAAGAVEAVFRNVERDPDVVRHHVIDVVGKLMAAPGAIDERNLRGRHFHAGHNFLVDLAVTRRDQVMDFIAQGFGYAVTASAAALSAR